MNAQPLHVTLALVATVLLLAGLTARRKSARSRRWRVREECDAIAVACFTTAGFVICAGVALGGRA